MNDESLSRVHERVDRLEDRVLTLELNTIKREGPFVEKLYTVESAVLKIQSNTDAIKTETDKSFTHNQAYMVIAIMIVNTILTVYLATK